MIALAAIRRRSGMTVFLAVVIEHRSVCTSVPLGLRRASLVERLVGYILQFVARGMCNKLAPIGQSDYESEPILAGLVGPMKQKLHLACDERKLSIARNVDGEAKDAQPRLV